MKTSVPATRLPFAMLMLTLVLAALDQTILSTALPVMARELPVNWPQAWVFSAYLLAATVVIALYGRLADLFGSKAMLLLAIGLFLFGSLACGASRDMRELILARALQGAGGGGLMTLSMLAVATLFTTEQRGRYQALLGAAYGVATMFGPLLGGTLVQHLTWHWAFWLNVPLALLAWVVLAWQLPPMPTALPASPVAQRSPAGQARQSLPPDRRASIDWLGALLLTGALVGLLLATQRRQLNLPEALSLGLLLALGLLLTLLFLWRQHRAAAPLVPLSLFARPAYAAVALIGMVSGLSLYAAVVFLPAYLQIGLHLTPTASAWHLMPLMAGVTVAAIASGRLLRAQIPAPYLARRACGWMLLSFGLLMAALYWLPAQPLALSASLLPLGLGLGLLFPIVTVVAQRVSPPSHVGIATAVPVMLRSLGGAGGVALLAAGLSDSVKELTAQGLTLQPAMAQGLPPLFGQAAAAVLLALLACRWLPRQLPPPKTMAVRAQTAA